MRIRVECRVKAGDLAKFAHLTTRWIGPICDSISISYAILSQPGWLLAVGCRCKGVLQFSWQRGSIQKVTWLWSGLVWLGLAWLGLAWLGLGCGSIQLCPAGPLTLAVARLFLCGCCVVFILELAGPRRLRAPLHMPHGNISRRVAFVCCCYYYCCRLLLSLSLPLLLLLPDI